MNKIILINFLLLSTISISFSQKLTNQVDSLGRWQGLFKHYDSKTGNLSSATYYKDDLRDGLSLIYYPNGLLTRSAYYKEGKLHGYSEVYREDGTLYKIENYYEDRPHGNMQYYDELERLKAEVNYKHGIPNGLYKKYYLSGRLMSKTTLIDDIENGTRKIYNDTPSNELIQEFEFVNGEKKAAKYYKNGKLIKEEYF